MDTMIQVMYVLFVVLSMVFVYWMTTFQESPDLQDSSGGSPHYRFNLINKSEHYQLSRAVFWLICHFRFHLPICFCFHSFNFSLFGVSCPPRGLLAQLLTLTLATFSVFLAARTMLGPIAGPGGTVFALLVLIVLALIGEA